MINHNRGTFLDLYNASCANIKLETPQDVEVAYSEEFTGNIQRKIQDAIQPLLVDDNSYELTTFDIRDIEHSFILKKAIDPAVPNVDFILYALLAAIPAGKHLRNLDDPAWKIAISYGRALVALDIFRLQDERILSVSNSGRFLINSGYKIEVDGIRYQFEPGEMERITRQIKLSFCNLGAYSVLSNFFILIKELYPVVLGTYQVARTLRCHTPGSVRSGSIPFGFLINIASSCPANGLRCNNEERIWKEAIELSVHMCSALNVEPYCQFDMINIPIKKIEETFRDLALYDHLFTLRQWPKELTKYVLLYCIGNNHDEMLRQRYRWDVDGVVDFFNRTISSQNNDPVVFDILESIFSDNANKGDIDLIRYFSHALYTVNNEYITPLSADKSNLMFMPFIRCGRDKYIAPCASLAGPSFYEATMKVLREALPKGGSERIIGDGTENLVQTLLSNHGIVPTHTSARYDIDGREYECDLVAEDNDNILFIEIKAKALTRASMSGMSGEALLDFAAGFYYSQLQALRHERVLLTNGKINFKDGTALHYRNRKITRLSVTLLDLGSIQNRLVLYNLYKKLSNSTIQSSDDYKKKKSIKELSESIQVMKVEMQKLEKAGANVNKILLECASLSVGQMYIILEGVVNLEDFVNRVTLKADMMSLNPVFEYYHFQKQGLVV